METLADPEAPNLDSLPSEQDEPVLSPVEEIRNPKGGNAEEESPFAVGDFVWAKAKGHPWWPAIISSPSESADRVMKSHRKTHSVPVAYFGDDDTLAWCEPKQLKPFVEVFDEMSRQSRSMSFLAAVGCCMEEIGRCLEVGITCRCMAGEARGKLLLGDAGRKLPVANYSPLEFLNRVRDVARDVEVASPLDSVRLRSWVFAFGKGFLQGESWVFQQRRGILELVDKIDLEEDEEASQAGNGFLECPDLSPSYPQRGGKRRSMSKLIAEMDLDTIEIDDDDEEEQQQILVPKKRKGKTDAVMAEEEAGSSSGRRERKKSKYLSPPYTNLREVGKFLSSLSKRLEGMSLRRAAGLSGSDAAGFSVINKFSGDEDDDKIPLSQIENMPACEIFSEFISTAAYPLHLRRNPSAKVVRCFFAMYRSSIYSDSAKFEDYKNLMDEYITKNEDIEKDDLRLNSHKKNSEHGDHQASGLGLKKSKNGQETKPESKQWNSNCSEKQKPGGKRLSKDGISQAPFELNLPMVGNLRQSKEKQKPTRGKKPGDKTSQEAPVELNLPSLDNLNDGKEMQKPSRGKKSGERTSHGAPLEVDLPLLEDLNDGKEKQKPSRGKKSGGRTSQRAPTERDLPLVDNLNDGKERQKPSRGKKAGGRTSQEAPVELDLSLVDDLIEDKEKLKPSGGKKSGWRTSQGVPVEQGIPWVGDLNEGKQKQKPSNGNKSGKSYSLGALLALECCRVDPSSEVKGKKRYGSKIMSKSATSQGAVGDLGKNLADASNESKRKRKPGWKKKILCNTTSFQAPADLDLRMEYDSNEGELGKGRKRWKHGTNAEAEDQKMASGSEAGDSEEKESISKSAYHSSNEVGLDVEPVSCRKPFIMNEKMMEGTEDAISNSLQNLGVRISRIEGAKSGRKKKNSEGPLKAKPGRRKDKLSGTCFEGQAALQLTFHSGIALPSIEDLVATYSKYGTLIDNRIELFKESNSALVVFAKSVDAESAFKDKAGPYGSVATYRLRYLPENIIPPQIPLVFSPSQLIPNISSAPQQLPDLNSAVQKPPLPYIRKSLETMISTLASSPSLINNISSSPDGLKPEARDNLVGEMQGLLLKVDKMLNGSGPGSSA